jgi:sugar phosphate isomerase/epimerase
LIGDTPMTRETLALLAATGLSVIDIEAIWLRAETRPSNYLSGFEAAAKLGARVIQAIGDDGDEARLADTYAALCEAAAPFELSVDLEYLAGAMTNSLEKALGVIKAAGPSNGGLLVDCLHINRCGTNPEALLRVDSNLIHVFQLCDGDARAPTGREALNHEARFGRKIPGEGEFDLASIWRVIPESAWISVEVPLGDERGKLAFAERARLLKKGADAFLARAGVPGTARTT